MKTLAEALVNERENKNTSLEFISEKTNIKLKSLQALEQGEFKKLPGKFYFKKYIISYLNAIGSDKAVFFETYGSIIDDIAFKANEEEKVYYPKLRYTRFKKNRVVLTLIVIVMIIILAVTAFYFYSDVEGMFNRFTSPAVKMKIPASPLQVPGFNQSYQQARWPVKVDIQFNKNCWTQIRRGNVKVEEKVFLEGEKTSIKGYDLQVVVGNPAGVRLLLNNREVKYLKGLARSERLVINPSTIKGLLER